MWKDSRSKAIGAFESLIRRAPQSPTKGIVICYRFRNGIARDMTWKQNHFPNSDYHQIYSLVILSYCWYQGMRTSRLSTRQNTAHNARNRLMVDHSPPRDIRKRKFQRLDRTPRNQHRDPLGGKVSTAGLGSSNSQATTRDRPQEFATSYGESHHEVSGSLPVKNKVCLLFQFFSSPHHNMILDPKWLPSGVSWA